MESLEQMIRDMLGLLKETYGWNIVLFDPYGVLRSMRDFSSYFSQYIVHDNPYCMQIKHDQALWRRCILCKWRTVTLLRRQKSPFYGECVFGVGEYAYPVEVSHRLAAYISIYGFRRAEPPERMHALLAKRLGVEPEAIRKLYHQALVPAPASTEPMATALSVLAYLLGQLVQKYQPDFEKLVAPDIHTGNQLPLVQAIGYIDSMFASQIKVRDIAEFCHISESYLQHLFKKTYGYGPYEMLVQRRLASACHLLVDTDLPVYSIALKVGFEDANYFSYAFHRRYSMTCIQYRKNGRALRNRLG